MNHQAYLKQPNQNQAYLPIGQLNKDSWAPCLQVITLTVVIVMLKKRFFISFSFFPRLNLISGG